jgi:hypothetical protein
VLTQIGVGLALVGATALIQALVMLSGFGALGVLRAPERGFGRHHTTIIVIVFVLYMFVAMAVEMAVWAWAFLRVEAVPDFETALFVSIGSFTTIGYRDAQVAPGWRLLVHLEGACGMLIFGWATALVIAAIQHLHVWPQPHHRRHGTDVAGRSKKS